MTKSARIITVGAEILLGNVIDRNAALIAKSMARLGIETRRTVIVGSSKEELKKAIASSFSEEDITVICGGLGPEKQDVTREAVSEAFNLPLEKNEAAANKIDEFLSKRGTRAKNSDLKQAYFPRGSVICENDIGTAHGFYIKASNGHYLFALPGKPTECSNMTNKISSDFTNRVTNYIVSKTVNMINITEAKIVHALGELTFPEQCSVVCSGDRGSAGVTVTVEADNKQNAELCFNRAYDILKASRIGEYIYGVDEKPEKSVVRHLRERGLTLSTAESCTGGLIAKLITDCPGSSEVFPGGIISYSNRIKSEFLDVKTTTLEKHGAVSHQTAMQMADGARYRFSTDFAISATGIAGPKGATKDKPVGLVYFAISQKNHDTEIYKRIFTGDREAVRRQSADFILKQLLLKLIDND